MSNHPFSSDDLLTFQATVLNTDKNQLAKDIYARWQTGQGVPNITLSMKHRTYNDLLRSFLWSPQVADLAKDKLISFHSLALERIQNGWSPSWGHRPFVELSIVASCPVYECSASGSLRPISRRKILIEMIQSEIADRLAMFSPSISRERSARGYQALIASLIFYWFVAPAREARQFAAVRDCEGSLSLLGHFFLGKAQRRNALKHPLDRHVNFLSSLLERCTLKPSEMDFRIILHAEAIALSGIHSHQDWNEASVRALADIQDSRYLLNRRPEYIESGSTIEKAWENVRSTIAYEELTGDGAKLVWYDFEEAVLLHEEVAAALCSKSLIEGWNLQDIDAPLDPEPKDTDVSTVLPKELAGTL